MKLTFPHLGNTYIPLKIIFDCLGVDYVIPPLSNKESLRIGSFYDPDEICLPIKITLGKYIQSIEQGADTILLVGSSGPCRFGEYGELQLKILKSLGYNLDFIILDPAHSNGLHTILKKIYRVINLGKNGNSKKMSAIILGIYALNLIDEIEKSCLYYSGYEVKQGDFKHLLKSCKNDCINTNDPYKAIDILKSYKRKLIQVKIDKGLSPIKIAIIGEIYTIIEPFSNLFIEDKLMDYGISIKRHLSSSWWLKDMLLKILKLNSLDIRAASKKYLPYYIGGHARECVGEAVLAANKKYNGAIQIFPVGCMPEIVSKQILQTISKDYNFPILSLVIDEMTGEAGYNTRIEAFIDLLERRESNVLFGY